MSPSPALRASVVSLLLLASACGGTPSAESEETAAEKARTQASQAKAPEDELSADEVVIKVAKYLARTYSKDRVLHPMRRVGGKGPGKGRLERITWDQALDEIAARFKAIAAEDPQQILPCSYAGTMGLLQYASMDRRFFHRLGASLLDRTLCSSAGKAGLKLTLGGSVGMDPERFDEAKLILIWGSNPITSNLHLWARCAGSEAPRREADRDRPVPQPHRREVPPAHRPAAGHGCRARAWA